MKLVFRKLETEATEIQISFDGGITWLKKNVAELKRTMFVEFTEADCPDLTKIKIKGKVKSLGDIEVEKNIIIDDNLDNFIKKEYFYGEVYDGESGRGYRLISMPELFKKIDSNWLLSLCLIGGESLGELCFYDGQSRCLPDDFVKPVGRLYLKQDRYGSNSEYFLIPTQFYIE